MYNSPEELPTPPLQTPVSIPFNWEEAPGKPRPDIGLTKPKPKAARSLELPPAKQILVSNNSSPSPINILEGGDQSGKGVTHTLSFSFGKLSFRSPEEAGVSKRQIGKERILNSHRWNLSSWRWGRSFRRNEVADGGNMDFLPSVMVDEDSTFEGEWSTGFPNNKTSDSYFNISHSQSNKPNFLFDCF